MSNTSFERIAFSIHIHRNSWSENDEGEKEMECTENLTAGAEDASFEDLQRYVRQYGISRLHETHGTCPAFISEVPEECEDLWEDGLELYYEIHIKTMDGMMPTVEQLCALA